MNGKDTECNNVANTNMQSPSYSQTSSQDPWHGLLPLKPVRFSNEDLTALIKFQSRFNK